MLERDGILLLDYWYYSKISYAVYRFPELNPDMFNYGITVPIYKLQRAVSYIDTNIPGF